MKKNMQLRILLSLALATMMSSSYAAISIADYTSVAGVNGRGIFEWTNPTWQFPQDGQNGGVLEFYASSPDALPIRDIHIAFSSIQNEQNPERWSYITIGGWNNTSSVVRKGNDADLFRLGDIGDNTRPSMPADAPGVAATGCYFRFTVLPNRDASGALVSHTVNVRIKGKNEAEFHEMADKNKAPFTFTIPANPGQGPWRYFSFNNWAINLKYSQIRVSPPLVVPTGFDDEAGRTDSITVGGNNIYNLSVDGRQLFWYNNDSMNPNPWEAVVLNGLPNVVNNGVSSTVALEALACGGDDTFCALDANGVVYRLALGSDKKSAVCTALPATAVPVARVISSIAVGNKDNIWAVDSNKNVLQHNGTDWIVRSPGVGIDVAAGADGHVVAVNIAGNPFFFNNNAWAKLPTLPGDLNIDQIAVVKAGDLYAVSEDSTLWHFANNTWAPLKNATGRIATGYSNVAANAGGTVFATSLDNEIYNTEVQFITVTPVAPAVAAPVPGTTQGAAANPVAVGQAPVTGTIRTLEMQMTPEQLAVYNAAAGNVATLPAQVTTTTIGDVTVVSKVAIAKKPAPKGKQTRAQAKKAGKVNVKAHKAAVKKASTQLVKAVNSKVKAVKSAHKNLAKTNKKVVKSAAAKKAAKKAAAKKAVVAKNAQTTTTPAASASTTAAATNTPAAE
jgi:hypothetical protein